MPVKFTVKLKAKDIFDYTLYRNYTSFSGILSAVLGVIFLWMAMERVYFGAWEASLMYWVFVFICLIYIPYTMWSRSKKQYKKNESFHHDIEYTFSDQGINVVQGEINVTNEWDVIVKAVSTRNSILCYTSKVRAIIFPKRCIGDKYEEVLKLIHANMPPEKVKIRHIQ
jgi:hypothetical protein